MSDERPIPSDGELLSAIQRGDERTQRDAKDHLIRKYDEKLTKRIEAYLYRKNCNQAALHAKGVRHQAWINALSNLENLHDPNKFEPWLARIWRNEANRHLKLCIGQQNTSVDITDETVLPPAQIATYYNSRDAAIDVDRMLTYADSISEEFGSIFRLYNDHGLDFDEIAQRLNKKKDNIRNQYYRGLRKIKAKFNDEDSEADADEE